MEALKKKYGLFTAVCMVVGIVIGSGIFFKAKDVIVAAGGNALYSILAWFTNRYSSDPRHYTFDGCCSTIPNFENGQG